MFAVFEPIIVSAGDTDEFEEKDMMKKTLFAKRQYDRLINYISEPMKKDKWCDKQNYESF